MLNDPNVQTIFAFHSKTRLQVVQPSLLAVYTAVSKKTTSYSVYILVAATGNIYESIVFKSPRVKDLIYLSFKKLAS